MTVTGNVNVMRPIRRHVDARQRANDRTFPFRCLATSPTMSSSLRPLISECVGRWDDGILTERQGSIPQEGKPFSDNSHEGVTSVEKGQSKTTGLLTRKP